MLATFIDAIKATVGPNGWLNATDGESYSRDLWGYGSDCLLVVRPANTEEVSAVMRLCSEHQVAVIPQGGNSNVCQMAVPLEGQQAIILSLSRMNRIIEINPECSTLTAEAGCILQTLQEAAITHDRVFAPDWGARGSAMVGGAVATNGGGLNVVRYGTTREQVLGMEVVLPDGTIWDGMRALVKDNSGYDLKHLFIGSEGTLGVITKVVFKLHPYQPESLSMIAVLEDMAGLMDLFTLARSHGGDKLTAFEFMPGLGVEKALGRYPDLQRPLETRSDWYILIRFSGQDAEEISDPLMALYEAAIDKDLVAEAALSQNAAQENNLWEIRDQMIPMQYFPGRMLKWDVSVPLDCIVDFLSKAQEIVTGFQDDAITYAVGHVGDGNYSVFPAGEHGPELDALSDQIYQAIDQLIWGYGGSIVAEHGVGSIYMDRMRQQKNPVEYQMMRTVKQAFDPKGLMNPGKLLTMGSD